ncbi:hypothetical protein FOA52_003747 [Chlamydomonas sp. UWO 241]|nr:hypothetical protein FOA52_003747 [Chlamydomonas sp. UWO 241]
MSGGGSRKRGAEEMQSTDPWATTSLARCSPAAPAVPQWRIENFGKLSSAPQDRLDSDSFEAGICTWRLKMFPGGGGDGTGTHVSVGLEALDAMWEPSARFKLEMVNQAEASKSHSIDCAAKFVRDGPIARGDARFFELNVLRDSTAGWLVKDTLVLKVAVTVEREDRFQLDPGGVPCDMSLKLPCGAELPVHGQLLQLASPFFCDALEDVSGSSKISVDGSLGTWTYILSGLYPHHDQPELTLDSVYVLLAVVHKYNFAKLLERLVAFATRQTRPIIRQQSSNPIHWLALAERLQLDELCEWCFAYLQTMTKEDLVAITTTVEQGGTKRVAREEFKQLGSELGLELFAILAEK